MFYEKDFKAYQPSVSMRDEKDNERVTVVDDFPSKDFNINPDTGFPSSEITLLLRAQNAEQFNMLAQRVKEIRSENLFPVDAPVSDIIASIKPVLLQSPSELQYYAEQVANRVLNLELLSREKASESKEAIPNEQSSTTVSNPSES